MYAERFGMRRFQDPDRSLGRKELIRSLLTITDRQAPGQQHDGGSKATQASALETDAMVGALRRGLRAHRAE